MSQRTLTVIDLFAGPGGWDLAARELGMDPLGIEWDDAACATRRAAGLSTVQADVAKLAPDAVVRDINALRRADWEQAVADGYTDPTRPPVDLDASECWGLIASPPCQAWSMAGKGGGRRDREHVIRCLGDLAAGNDTRAEHAAECEDDRSMLVVEPLRWALALEPEWIALEQVPPVLELWTMVAQLLTLKGYSTWAGVLEAERYGVPQTRERAILMASRVGPVQPPRPTHQRYVPGQPQRHDVTFDGEVLPWVSMAEALGWGMTGRPSGTVVTPRDGGGPSGALDGGSHARGVMRDAIESGDWAPKDVVLRHTQRNGSTGEYCERRGDEPAFTVAGNADRWTYRNGNQANAAKRPVTAPAPTVHFGHASNKVDWVRENALQTDDWPEQRPATTIAGDARVFQPGGHHQPGQQPQNAVRVTVQEAAILQSFPPDYPWQGSRSKQYEQCGNAIPPLLAKAILGQFVVGHPLPAREEGR